MEEWDISVEEMYEYNRSYQTVACDRCGERQTARNIHFMDSFKEPDVTLAVCGRCYNKMLGKRIRR